MTDETDNNPNPDTAKKAIYYLIIETHDVEDTDWEMDEINEITRTVSKLLPFGSECWVDEVEYETDETDEPNTPENA